MKIPSLIRMLSCLSAIFVLQEAAAEPAPPPRWPHMPYLVTNPGPEYAADNRMYVCSAGGITVAPNGRLWASWDSGGHGEDWFNYIMLATSGDGGRTWSDPVMVVDPPFQASYSNLWTDPEGWMWFTFSLWPIRYHRADDQTMKMRFDDIRAFQAFTRENSAEGSTLWAMTTGNPGDHSPKWNSPRLISTDYNHMNTPTVMSNGAWAWPTATIVRTENGEIYPFRPLFSADNGKTFHFRGLVPTSDGRNFDESMIVHRRDGMLWLLSRMSYGIGESFSTDQGHTWTPMEPSAIKHTVSRFYIGRLQSGKLLLIKHGQVDEKTKRRERLMAFLSGDDGKSWEGGLGIDERVQVSYPDATQGADGTIYVLYDFERHGATEILMAAFTEEDVAAGEPVSGKARFRQIVDKALGHNPRHGKRFSGEARENADGAELLREPAGAFAADGAKMLEFALGVRLFQDRDYTLAECPEPLRGAQFLPVKMEGQKTLTCARKGVVYLATPLPDRNPRGSQSAEFLEQGFEKAALPEFKLFEAPSHPANLCAVYQKKCAAGEQIEFGMWAVPVFFSGEAAE